jgi:N-acyl-D-amino-acid deacylase
MVSPLNARADRSSPSPAKHSCFYRVAIASLLGLALAARSGQTAEPFDVVIRGGRVVDGTGAPWYVADVGIRSGKIAKIGRIEASDGKRSIDAQGLIVAPGFIDMMGQTATPMLDDPASALNLLTQGITTINAGEGVSAAPLREEEGRRRGWRTMADYFKLLDEKGLPINVAQTIGHTQVRQLVIGDVDRRPSDAEMQQMQELVREAMQAGAIGVSTALIYPPAIYAPTEEIARLAEVAGQYGGRYYTHMRNEGDKLEEAIDEALEIGRRGNAPVHIFHLKTAGRQNWGKMLLAIAKIKAAREAGQQVTADIYPYINNGLGIAAFIHPRHFAEGHQRLIGRLDDAGLRAEIRTEMETTIGWENWFRHVGRDWNKVVIGQTAHPRYKPLVGGTVAELAKANSEDPWDTFFNLVRSGAFALPESMTEANKIVAMQQPFVSFCTDVGPAGGSQIASHPRAFGSFPRLLSRYVRDLGAISLERAVAQASASAANNILAYDRGRIAEGLAADIIVFDYLQLTDKATFSQPSAVSEGMQHVLVNGTLVLENGKVTGQRPGRVLRGPGYTPNVE